MIKRVLVVLMGLLPLLLGFIQNHLMMTTFLYTGMPGTVLIGIGIIVLWFILGMLSVKMLGNKAQALILLNAPALLLFVLIFVQTVIVGHFWLNIMGLASQFFYMPTLGLSAIIAGFLPFGAGFVLMTAIAFGFKVGASALGIKVYNRGRQ